MNVSIGFVLAALRRALRQLAGSHRQKRPVRPVVRALLDPAQKQRLLGVGQRQAGFGRRHHVVVVREDSPNELAALRVPRLDDGPAIVQGLERAGSNVQPQLLLAFAGVWPVTPEAAVGEEWTDLSGEVYRRGASGSRLSSEDNDGEHTAGDRGGDARAPATHGWDSATPVWRCQFAETQALMHRCPAQMEELTVATSLTGLDFCEK